jgi:cytochrome c oxidase subunit 2
MRCADRHTRSGQVWCPRLAAAGALLATSGCAGVQSALAPAGREAERIASLTWWMTAGALVVWIGVIALAWWCARVQGRAFRIRLDRWLIVVGGVVVPIVVLTILLIYGLAWLPPLVARAPAGSLQVVVTGEQWWWRVRYLRGDGDAIDTANEIRVPVGEPVQFLLDSDNVIHSFWIPSLAGKMDMIPGRITHLAMRPMRTGTFRGACAEYCGLSHAQMAFDVAVVDRSAFEAWLRHQASPAQAPAGPLADPGRALFFASGCGACHTIRGTSAAGLVGPDLTHVGSRRSLAAGALRNDRWAFERWLTAPEHVKPGAHMPRFGMLPAEDIRALAAYLESLE